MPEFLNHMNKEKKKVQDTVQTISLSKPQRNPSSKGNKRLQKTNFYAIQASLHVKSQVSNLVSTHF